MLHMTPEELFVGSMLGLALGDAMGAPHEGGFVGRFAWWVLGIGHGETLRWTDDTQMALVLAESLADHGRVEADELAMRWAWQMDSRRGYGPGTRKLLLRVLQGEPWQTAGRAVYADGSLGNGAAMRAAPIGLFFQSDFESLRRAAELASSITHAHPLGIEGGVLMARATALVLNASVSLARPAIQQIAFDPDAFLVQLADGCTQREVRPGGRLVLADDRHDIFRLWPEPAGFSRLWHCYLRTYDRNGNDPSIGHRLVSLLHAAGATPVRNTWLFFGACAGQVKVFSTYVDNLVGVLQSVRQPILSLGEFEPASFDGCLRAIREWSARPDAALWYAVSWAEGRRAEAGGKAAPGRDGHG
jgi:hypothetical protein